jgi:two-component system invasion response regulator UvrY
MDNTKTSVVLVDDHILLRNGLANLIGSFGEFTVLFEADNGKKFINALRPGNLPDIVLLDINMPEMDGYETAGWLKINHPEIKILALSMYDNDNAIIRMLKCGARGYVLKDIDPLELKAALLSVWQKGYYYSELITGKLIHRINQGEETETKNSSPEVLNKREIEFLILACSEKTYKEIAECMFLSPRTIDGYRDFLFQKLGVKTRVGLVMYAIKNGIVNL